MILESVRTPQTEKAQVTVGLVTCNSEGYLIQQIESILDQVEVDIHVFILDSGSTDRTIEILKDFKFSYPEVFSITLGDRNSPLESFKKLFCILPADYPVFLCDHDDIWDRDKVKKTLNFMAESGFDIVGTARSYINEANQIIGKSPKPNRGLSFENAMIENVLYGNTISIAAGAMVVAKNLSFSKAVMHDSYLYLYFSAFGKVGYLHENLTHYRIYSRNTVGIKNRNLSKVRKSVKSFREQAIEFEREYAERIPPSLKSSLRIHSKSFKSKSTFQRIICTLRSPTYCQKWTKSIVHKCVSMTIK
jgi:glycosyltransferase involved in cell wall biosynthesis